MTTNYQTGEQSSTDLKEKLKQDLGNKAREASRQFADRGKEKAEALSGKAADVLDDMEAAADAEAEELERRGWDDLSGYIREMADGIGGLSENLRHKSVDELIRSASDLARHNTGLFVLGSVAIGFGLSRFAKASAGEGQARRDFAGYGRDGYAYPGGESAAAYADGPAQDSATPFESH